MEPQVLPYERSSSLDLGAGRLVLETAGGVALLAPVAHPRFFDGFLTRPLVAANGLSQVAQVAATSYLRREPPPLGPDPVVTSDGQRLRFESFSLCGGVLARLDVSAGGLDGDLLDRGTTNVDVNEPLRRLLAGVSPEGLLHLLVGSEGLVATTAVGSALERHVPLSTRWLRGFAEAQQLAAGFEPRIELPAADAVRFLTGLSRGASGWVAPAGRGWRLSSRPQASSVYVSGVQRLDALLPLLRHASTLRAYGPLPVPGATAAASAWEATMPEARFTLTLSPDPNRGFSGEGAALADLALGDAVDGAELIGRLLRFQPRLEPDVLAEQTGLSRDRVRSALACLAVAGRVGYDVGEASYFHRELPYDAAAVARLNPRLRNAEELVAVGAVRILDDARAEVRSGEAVHRVRAREDGTTACTCRWWTTHRGSRGPCKHVLAVSIVRSAPVPSP